MKKRETMKKKINRLAKEYSNNGKCWWVYTHIKAYASYHQNDEKEEK